MKLLILVTIFLSGIAGASCFEIFRNHCRRSALFKMTDRDAKITANLVAAVNSANLPICVKYCLRNSACKTINFNPSLSGLNCELHSLTKAGGAVVVAAVGWKHYEPVQQTVTPGCLRLGNADACSPGYRCEDSCDGASRFRCIDINECLSNPCLNGGACNNLINRYRCSCVPGYAGSRCETDINECASNPCHNGGGCHNHVNRYSCSCVNGFSGSRCENAPSGWLFGKRKKR